MSAPTGSLAITIETTVDGAALFATSPAHVLVVIGLGLLAGQQGSGPARALRLALPVAWVCGGLVGMTWPEAGPLRVPLILTFVSVGGLVALDRKLARSVVVALAAAAGLLHGYVQGREMAGGGLTWPALLGATAVVLVLAMLLPACVVRLKPAWTRIAVRVAGSWIVAIGLLMLGWLARGSGHRH